MVDINGFPIGLMMGMAQKADAVEAYSRLTEAEKERVLNEWRDANIKALMDSIIERLCGRLIYKRKDILIAKRQSVCLFCRFRRTAGILIPMESKG